jgi:hypothetical protein
METSTGNTNKSFINWGSAGNSDDQPTANAIQVLVWRTSRPLDTSFKQYVCLDLFWIVGGFISRGPGIQTGGGGEGETTQGMGSGFLVIVLETLTPLSSSCVLTAPRMGAHCSHSPSLDPKML